MGSGLIDIFDSCGPLSLNDDVFFSKPAGGQSGFKGLYSIGFYLLLLVLWPKSSIHVYTDTCRITLDAWSYM